MKTRVLVAERDPDPEMKDSLRLFLEGCGYEVDGARDGLECLAKMIERPPAVLVLKQGLLWGGADGIVSRMREGREVPLVPVILISSDGHSDEVAELIAAPIVACLHQPFPMSKLLYCLMAAEQRSSNSSFD